MSVFCEDDFFLNGVAIYKIWFEVSVLIFFFFFFFFFFFCECFL